MMVAFPFFVAYCAKEETGQRAGDVRASIDESGGSGGSLALAGAGAAERTFARLAPEEVLGSWWRNIGAWGLPY